MRAATADNNGNGSMADPLFLFACGLEGWRRADTHAGWELIRAAKSGDRDAKAVGLTLLSDSQEDLTIDIHSEKEAKGDLLQGSAERGSDTVGGRLRPCGAAAFARREQ